MKYYNYIKESKDLYSLLNSYNQEVNTMRSYK